MTKEEQKQKEIEKLGLKPISCIEDEKDYGQEYLLAYYDKEKKGIRIFCLQHFNYFGFIKLGKDAFIEVKKND